MWELCQNVPGKHSWYWNMWFLYSSACSLDQHFPTFLAPETGFVEDNFSMDWGGGVVLRWFKCILFIVNFISNANATADLTGVRSHRRCLSVAQRLGTPYPERSALRWQGVLKAPRVLESEFCYWMWPWASDVTSLHLWFNICRVGIKIFTL